MGLVARAGWARPTLHQAARQGAYLTDGRRLYRVVDSDDGRVALENCRAPQENPWWINVGEVVKTMRLVRPSG